MIFSELYGVYYRTIAEILKAAMEHNVTAQEIRDISQRYAFRESSVHIEKMLTEGRWQLLKADGTTLIQNPPILPLTTTQKQWLKAISLDPRIRLFLDELPDLSDVQPLFTPEDVYIFDQYADGDSYTDESYRARFRLILDAVRHQYPLYIEMNDKNCELKKIVVMLRCLEYSEKDDKFRLIDSNNMTINLGRIQKCTRYTGEYIERNKKEIKNKQVVFELKNERNALERVLMHFAHLEKQVIKLNDDIYLVTLIYDENDEKEMIIRILSFGPMIKVTEPESFIQLIRERLRRQRSCGL